MSTNIERSIDALTLYIIYLFRGKNVLNQKSELQKAMEKHKEQVTKRELEAQRQENMTPFEKVIEQRAKRLEIVSSINSCLFWHTKKYILNKISLPISIFNMSLYFYDKFIYFSSFKFLSVLLPQMIVFENISYCVEIGKNCVKIKDFTTKHGFKRTL